MSRREAAMRRACPRCSAQPGFVCVGARGARRATHQERSAPTIPADTVMLPPRPRKRDQAGSGFYASPEWRALRYAVLCGSDGRCQCCGARPTRGKPLHIDHIKPRSRFPELALARSNLQVLCADCNLGKGNTDTRDWRDQPGSATP